MKLIPGETDDTQIEELFIVYLRALYGLSGIKGGSLDLQNVELNVKAIRVPPVDDFCTFDALSGFVRDVIKIFGTAGSVNNAHAPCSNER